MKDRADVDRLKDIKIAIKKIEKYTKDLYFDEFKKNDLVQDAVFKNFEIIGEAAYKISKATKDNFKNIEWRKLEGLRHKLVHDYYEIDLAIVWNTKEKKLPELYKSINKVIRDLKQE